MKQPVKVSYWLLFAALLCLACQNEGPVAPSILVLAAENLPVDAVNCVNVEESESSDSGFQVLCGESVRYTHAFTPSPMSQAALASLLTGLWPFEHKVRTNGASSLSAQFETAPEVAYAQGYKTSFFSGGPPILRKSGLAQGFEVFEDSIFFSWKQLHRPAEDVAGKFIDWLEDDVGSHSFFSVLYFSDLQIFELPPSEPSGRPMDRSYAGRKARLDRVLFQLIERMKSQKRWNNTFVILVGLNGYSDQERFSEVTGSNLHVENTQVVLLLKGPQKKERDLNLYWGIDANVSLVDLGQTILQVLGRNSQSQQTLLKPISLNKNLTSPHVYWDVDRPLLLESHWAKWKDLSNARYAVKFGPYLYIHDLRGTLYNSLSDRRETSPFYSDLSRLKNVSETLKTVSAEPWTFIDPRFLNYLDVGMNLWDPSRKKGVVQEESENDAVLAGWLAVQALSEQNWQELLRLGQRHKKSDWEYIASQNMPVPQPLSKKNTSLSPCWKSLLVMKANALQNITKQCDDTLFVNILSLKGFDQNSSDYSSLREVIARTYYQLMMDRKVSQMNFVNGLIWDTNHLKALELTAGELLLSLPEHKKILTYCNERLLSEKRDDW